MSPLSFPWDLSDPLIKSQKMSAKSAIFRHPEDFFAGTLSLSIEFWKTHILRDCDPHLRIKYLNWLKNGVTVREFLNPYTTGIYKNRVLNSFLPSKAFFPNNVPPKHQQWVNTEITTLLKFGVILKEMERLSPIQNFPHTSHKASANGKRRADQKQTYI